MSVRPEPATQNSLVALIELCNELFATDDITGGDNFFMLGGTSLTAVELTIHLRAGYGFELPVEAVFTENTLADLALCCKLPQEPE